LAFTDSDCIPDPHWLQEGVKALRKINNQGMVAGEVEVVFNRDNEYSVYELYDTVCSFRQQEFLEHRKYAVTANLFVSKQVVERVGCFNPELTSGGDCEWGNRVYRHGVPQRFCKLAAVKHPARNTFRQVLDKSLRVTSGTKVTLEQHEITKKPFFQYIYFHTVQRPKHMVLIMKNYQTTSYMRFKVICLYFVIKALQSIERLRILSGGTPKR
jgi:GT2 family glycosyltransferase